MSNPLFTHRCSRCLLPFTKAACTGNCPKCLGVVLPHVEACSTYRAANPALVIPARFDPYDGPGTVPLSMDELVIPIVDRTPMGEQRGPNEKA